MMLMPVGRPAQDMGASGLHRGSYEACLQVLDVSGSPGE